MNKAFIYSFGSVGALGIVGLLFNVLIPIFYGPEGLGLFNLIWSLFIVASQFSTFGLHYSTLKYTAEHAENHILQKTILSTALFNCGIMCIPSLLFCFIIPFVIPRLFKFENAQFCWFLAIPGLLFFSFNKIFLSFMNGLKLMERYAIGISLRYIFMLVTFLPFIMFNLDLKFISFVFLLPEIFLFFWCIFYNNQYIGISFLNFDWIQKHFAFSIKSFLAGASIELNSRVDVLILSYFQTEKEVGIYSFALFFVEGVLQVISVFRNILNPYLTELYYKKDIDELSKKIKKFGKNSLLISFVLSILCVPFFLILYYFFNEEFCLVSLIVFLIITLGVTISSFYLPIQFFANQIGSPIQQTRINLLILGSNIIFNIIFVYFFGLYGAAIGTSLSFFVTLFIIKSYARNILINAR
ncbi:MAG: oligosaccharide flippase family protein [Alphaproteobacteria bacterium]|nr:oligosaccharide flippase family protein [Alphaproteobacteria bacterium]